MASRVLTSAPGGEGDCILTKSWVVSITKSRSCDFGSALSSREALIRLNEGAFRALLTSLISAFLMRISPRIF